MQPWHFIVGIFALIIAIFILSYMKEKKRREELKKVSALLGFSFTPRPEEDITASFINLKMFQKGHSRKAYNVLRGKWGSNHWMIFDYKYTTGGGKSSSTHTQTIACSMLGNVSLPAFNMGPESIFHRIGDKLGFHDIDFSSHHEFSKKYLLKGNNEEAVRKLFASWILDYFQNRDRIVSIEADGDRILFYNHGKRINPGNLQSFIEEADQALRMFKKSIG